jgi:ABC-type multidrug transport system fused ATPase/permease subunit
MSFCVNMHLTSIHPLSCCLVLLLYRMSDPAFLVMDEPASALDADGEAAVLEALKQCRGAKGRGLLLITHNPKSLEQVDCVLVMKQGCIVERGAFADLRSNAHSELCKLMPDLL